MTQHPVEQPSIWIQALAAVGLVALLGAAVVLSNSAPAAAAGLDTFTSCADLRAHIASAATVDASNDVVAVAGDAATGALRGATSAAPATARESASERSGGTNTQVDGIDELDMVDVLADGRSVVARPDRLVLVDASGDRILAELPVTGPTQLTVDDTRSRLWAVSDNGRITTLTRAAIEDAGFTSISTWTVAGRLVDLRRDGARVHLVVVDGDAIGLPAVDVPFDGTSPVACDQVLHSPLPGGTATTLVTTFDANGELAPTAATEIVGAGDNVLVTDAAVYVSTPTWEADHEVTGIHRFAIDDLRHTGSGSVDGRLLNQFALDEHDGHLRAAVTRGGGGVVVGPGGPIRVDGDEAIVGIRPSSASPVASAPAALNEVVVFDVEGSLDVVGRTPLFGHPGETLHGIRFAGDIAYAVTFLQTDPLYVIDLADATNPAVLGEIQVPGFSAYLHPISATQVIGFGPGDDGRIVARLFDITDPSAPRLLDTAVVGEDSPIAQDHHALRVAGDHLVVAANRYVTARAAFPYATVVVLAPDGAHLGLRSIDTNATDAQRILPLDDGYLIVGSELTKVAADGSVVITLDRSSSPSGR